MSRPLSVGVAGLGTVGGGVLKVLRENADLVAARAGRPIVVTAVSARDRSKDRGVPVAGLRWYDDPVALASDPGVDVVVEAIGGSEGSARALAEATIAAGKSLEETKRTVLLPQYKDWSYYDELRPLDVEAAYINLKSYR